MQFYLNEIAFDKIGAMTCQEFCDNLEIQNFFEHIISVYRTCCSLKAHEKLKLSLIPARKNSSVGILGNRPQKRQIKLK